MTLDLPPQARQAIEAHVRACHPEECCGLIALDSAGQVRFVYPLTNAEASTSTYTIDPVESYHAFVHADRMGWEIGGAFHSHPDGPNRLSARDLDDSVEGWLYLLASPDGIKCWRIGHGWPEPVTLAD